MSQPEKETRSEVMQRRRSRAREGGRVDGCVEETQVCFGTLRQGSGEEDGGSELMDNLNRAG